MKRHILAFAALFCLFALPGSAMAAQDKWELSLTTGYMDRHPTIVNVILPWIETIKQATGGKVIIQNFNPGTICPDTEVYSAVESGLVAIGGASQFHSPGRFLRSEALDLPLITSNAEAGSLMSWDAYNNLPTLAAEEKDVKVLWHWASAPFVLHTIKKPVNTLEDLKGLKIIGWSAGALDVIRALGASPVQVGPNDTYLSLQRGMADGVLCPLAPVRSLKINEAAKYTTMCNLMVTSFVMAMNKDVWDSFPPEIKKAFEENSGAKLAAACGKSLDDGASKDKELLTAQGHTFIQLDPAELERWRTAVQPIHETWLKKVEGKGVKDAKQILDYCKAKGAEYAAQVAAQGK